MERKLFSLLCVLLIVACQLPNRTDTGTISSVYLPPVTVPLNMKEKYAVNQVTGDSIPYLNNYLGDTIRTGVETEIKGITNFTRESPPPMRIITHTPLEIPVFENMRRYTIAPSVTVLRLDTFPVYIQDTGVYAISLTNIYGDTIGMGKPILIPEEYVPFIPSKPQTAMPPRMRDFTSHAIQYIDTDAGLSSPNIYTIAKDDKGDTWIGSDLGVSRYDGSAFSHYGHLTETRIPPTTAIMTDSRGNTWFATHDGLFRLNEKGLLSITEQKKQLYIGGINAIKEALNGDIWLGLWNGVVARYRPGKNKESQLMHYLLNPNQAPGMVKCIEEDEHGNMWFGTTRDGIYVYDGKGFKHITHETGLPTNSIWSMRYVRGGKLWCGTTKGACLIELNKAGRTETIKHFMPGKLENLIVRDIDVADNHIWLGTWGQGVMELVLEGDSMHLIQYSKKEGLSGDLVTHIEADTQGYVWVGTMAGGINIIRPHAIDQIADLPGINNLLIRSIVEDHKCRIWFGTEGQGISRVLSDPRGPTTVQHFTSSDPFVIRWTCSIAEDRFGHLWFGSTTGMMALIEELPDSRLTFDHYSGQQGFTDAWVATTLEDQKGNLWFGTFGGGLIYAERSASGEILSFTHFTEDQGFASNYVIDLAEDPHGNIWAATDINGLCQLKLHEDQRSVTMQVYSENEGLLSNHLSAIATDGDSAIWISTEWAGLCQLILPAESRVGRCVVYTESQGMPADRTKSILSLQTNNGNKFICLGTTNGLGLLSHESGTWGNHLYGLDKRDGLKRCDFGFRALAKDSKGFIWAGTGEGLQRLEPKIFATPDFLPQPRIRRVDVRDRYVSFHHDSIRQQVKFDKVHPFENLPLEPSFPAKNNHLTFYFSCANLAHQHNIRYSYKIDEWEEDWSPPSTETKADYRNLPYGSYTFLVSAIGPAQQWSEPTQYSFTIRPPWYLSWWAYMGYIFIGGGMATRLHRYRLDRKLEIAEKKRLKELDAYKSKLYTNITHEFRSPLTLIHGPVTHALTTGKSLETKELTSIHRQSERLQQLINQMLDLQKIEMGKMKPNMKLGDIIPQINSIYAMFNSWALDKSITMSFTAIPEQIIMDADQEILHQIIGNLLSNAIKHTPRGGTIALKAQLDAELNTLHIAVQDTGVGIPQEDLPHIFDRFFQSSLAAAGGSGIGLSLTKNLVELLGGAITVSSTVGKGTLFTIALPVTRNALPADAAVEDRTLVFTREPKLAEQEAFPFAVDTDKNLVLIVEDNPEVRQYIRSCLEGEYAIITAIDGDEGIQQAFEHVPDLIISDVMMPGKDGFELCAKVKSDIRTSHIPVILLTGKGDHQSLLSGIERGADAYITKPFDPVELQLRSRKLMELRAALSDHYRRYGTVPDPQPASQSSAVEHQFLKNLRTFIEEHMNDAQFNMDMLCHHMAMSHPQLHRKITALTGESTGKFVRTVRLTKAVELLRQSDMTVSEIAYETGFSDPGYFARVFSKEYNVSPSEFRTRNS